MKRSPLAFSIFFISLISFIFSAKPQTYAKQKDFIPNTFSAIFIQQYKSVLDGRMKKGAGTIEYMYPAHIRIEVSSPDPIIFISNPSKTYYYTPPFFEEMKGELKIEKTQKTSLSYFFDLLKFGLKSNKYYTVHDKIKKVELNFREKISVKMNIEKATLYFKSSQKSSLQDIDFIEIIYLDQKKVQIILKKIRSSVIYKKDHFQLKKP